MRARNNRGARGPVDRYPSLSSSTSGLSVTCTTQAAWTRIYHEGGRGEALPRLEAGMSTAGVGGAPEERTRVTSLLTHPWDGRTSDFPLTDHPPVTLPLTDYRRTAFPPTDILHADRPPTKRPPIDHFPMDPRPADHPPWPNPCINNTRSRMEFPSTGCRGIMGTARPHRGCVHMGCPPLSRPGWRRFPIARILPPGKHPTDRRHMYLPRWMGCRVGVRGYEPWIRQSLGAAALGLG